MLLCAGREIAGPGPERGVVFQNHSLLPWLTCFQNVYLAVERVFAAAAQKRAGRAASCLLFYALWHRRHIEGRELPPDTIAALAG